MSNIDVHFTSNTNEWSTPQDFYNRLDEEFHFGLDVAATHENAKCELYFTKEDDAISKNWHNYGTIWCNPPYGPAQKDFIRKAQFEYANYGTKTVLLIPARTDTLIWGNFIFKYASEIRFITGRLKFGGSTNSAPFPSAVVCFGTTSNSPVITTMKARI